MAEKLSGSEGEFVRVSDGTAEPEAQNRENSKQKKKRRRRRRRSEKHSVSDMSVTEDSTMSKEQESAKQENTSHPTSERNEDRITSSPSTPQNAGGRSNQKHTQRDQGNLTPKSEAKPGHYSKGAKESPSSGHRPQATNNSINRHGSPAKSTPRRNKSRSYDEYLTKEEVSQGLKRGDLLQGTIRINPKNFELAWISLPGMKRDVLIEGRLRRNRALHGDVVALRLLPRENWKEMKNEMEYQLGEQISSPRHPSQQEKTVDRMTQSAAAMSLSPDTSTHRDIPDDFLQKTACVVFIIEKKHSRIAGGHLKPFTKTHKQEGLFTPSDSRLPRLRIPRDLCPAGFFDRPQDFESTLFVARITSWKTEAPMDHFYAIGAIVQSLGEAGEIEPETEGILLEYGIDSGPFPDEALACLPEESPWRIPEEELSSRRDFRDDCVFTIDPLTARDLDDALHCKVLDDGNLEIGVHIADVSFFVLPDSALDLVARERATSTYMVQKVIPMLPRRLCEELCSLNPGEDRLTFSIVWKMDERGDILNEWKGRGIIRSRVKMAYEHAQEMIEHPKKTWKANELPPISDSESVEDISASVNRLQNIARRLRQKRIDNGALRLDQVKLSFDLKKATGLPIGYHVHELREANWLIEEFMLLANMATARHIYEAFPDLALLRRHPKPHPKQLDDFLELCSSFSIPFDGNSSKAVQESLARFKASSTEKYILVSLIMKPMKNAKYFCSGVVEESMYGHYALSVPLYTHFTSPIRRYADITVHRLLAASLKIDKPFLKTSEDVDMIAVNCNDRKQAAKTAGELSSDMFFGIFVRECGPMEEDGIVASVMDQSFDVLVPNLGITRRIFCKYSPGVKAHEFSKAEKKKPAEMKLVWSVKNQQNGKVVEVEQVLRIFTEVRVILTSESQVEGNAKPFKFFFELVPPDLWKESASGTSGDTAANATKSKDAAAPNPTSTQSEDQLVATDGIRRKLFESERVTGEGRSVNGAHHGIDTVDESANHRDSDSASEKSDDVIVESVQDEDM